MRTFKVLKSFGGVISGNHGEKLKITSPEVIKDLTEARYIEEVKTKPLTKSNKAAKEG